LRRFAFRILPALIALPLWLCAAPAFAHDVAAGDRAFVQSVDGAAFLPLFYLGAKHMVTGYDHILFLIGVVFYLHRLRDVLVYVSMFTIGHSATLMLGTLLHIGANAYLIDAIIGLSVVYKGVENLGGLRKLGIDINAKLAVLVFGLFHGAGLATKLMDLSLSQNGLLINLIGFNIGVEVGQVLVLCVVVSLLNVWRRSPSFQKGARVANWGLISAGLLLVLYQLMELARHA
jgi:hypothetical protein